MKTEYACLMQAYLLKDLQDKGDEGTLSMVLAVYLEKLCAKLPPGDKGSPHEVMLRLFFKHQGNMTKVVHALTESATFASSTDEHEQQLSQMYSKLGLWRRTLGSIDRMREAVRGML